MIRRLLSRRNAVTNAVKLTRGGDHHHGPSVPPFGRQRPPTSKMVEEPELIWDDFVAPEACIDFDAPHISLKDTIIALLTAFGVVGGIYGLIALYDPVANAPAVGREAVLSAKNLRIDLGLEEPDAEYEYDF